MHLLFTILHLIMLHHDEMFDTKNLHTELFRKFSMEMVGHAQLGRQVRAGKPVLGRAYGHRAPHL